MIKQITKNLSTIERKTGLHFDKDSLANVLEEAKDNPEALEALNTYYGWLSRSTIDAGIEFNTDTGILIRLQEYKEPTPERKSRAKGSWGPVGNIPLRDLGFSPEEVHSLDSAFDDNGNSLKGGWMRTGFPKVTAEEARIKNELRQKLDDTDLTKSQVIFAAKIIDLQAKNPELYPIEMVIDANYQKAQEVMHILGTDGIKAFLLGDEDGGEAPVVIAPPPVPPEIPAPAPVLPVEAAPTPTPTAVPEKSVAPKPETASKATPTEELNIKTAQAALEVARDELTNARDVYARMLTQERKLNGLLERFFSSKEKKQQIIDDLETARADYHEKTKNLVECYTGERALLAQAVFAQKQENRTAIEQGRALAEKMTGWWKGQPMLAKVAVGGLIGVVGAGAVTLGGAVGGALGGLAVGAGGVLQVIGFSRNTLAIGDFAKNKTFDILLKHNSLKELNTLTADNVKVMGEQDLANKLNTYYYFAEAGLDLTGEKAPPGYKVLKAEYDRRESALKRAGHAGTEALTTPAQRQPTTLTTPQQAPEPEPLKTDWAGLSMREKMEIIEKRGLRVRHFLDRNSLKAEEELRWRMQTTENKARLTGFVVGAGVAAGIALGARTLGQSLGQMIKDHYFPSSPDAAPAALEGSSTLNSTGAAPFEYFDPITTVNRGEGLTAPVMRQLAQIDMTGDGDETLKALAETVGYRGSIHNHQLFARQIAIHDNLLNINGKTEEWVQAGQHVKLNADTGNVELYNADSTKVAWDANQNHQEGFTKTKGWYNKLHSKTEAQDTAIHGTSTTLNATPTGAVPPETPIPVADETVVAGTDTDLPAAGAESLATPEVAETPKVTPPVKNTPQGNPAKPKENIAEAVQAGIRPAAEATNPPIETAFSSTTFEGHAQHIDISIDEKILGEKPLDKIRVLGDIGFNKQGELITDALQLGYDGDKYETMRQLAKYLHFPESQFDQVWRSQSLLEQNGLVLRLTDLFKLVVAQKNIEGNSNEALNKALNAKINKAYEILAKQGLQFE